MSSKRWADIIFFLGFAGIMWAIFAGSWNPGRDSFVMTVGALAAGLLLVIISIVLLYKQRVRRNEDESQD